MKFIDYNSPEKEIIKEKFNTIPYMDVWISSIVEGYIYEKVTKVNEYSGSKEEYIERYGKKEGEYKMWHQNGKIKRQGYYKEGKEEGEFKWWWNNGQLHIQLYYKEGKLDGEWKEWYEEGQLMVQTYHKEGKLEGEYREWNERGELSAHKIYTGGEVVEVLK
jgi:antitoxin component YwqK of YwqJK toxin-antitoxin module